ncbi:hypothetical protein B0I35DRAFT_365734 [Stachybotrys elegans]|uniref:C2H2-type domain-containing protein n=1 Tax=Stachybotrys elegans TaxID=80388 RepID=A0A8K0SA51_9HYPO|nr:hypothetical protein B0I35DRAFT_365734 [Stachybotrys elegans]
MDPFIHEKEYPFIIYRQYQFTCIPYEIESNFKRHHSQTTSRRSLKETQAIVEAIPGLIRTQEELRTFEPPPATTEPIPYITPPVSGFRCDKCGHIVETEYSIKAHWREEHDWVNPRGPGRQPKRRSQHAATPWTVVRLFPRRAASCWFEVGRGQFVPARNGPPEEEDEAAIRRLIATQEEEEKRLAEEEREMIDVADDRKEPNE